MNYNIFGDSCQAKHQDVERPEEAQALQDPTMNSGCAGDCTGLIPAVSGEEEYDSYAELYPFLPPEEKKIRNS